ncbi:MAG TPA: MmgE/PrpD family protein, partial [Desulfuromonadales bacterium]|nr:MmgE/PrpD family protein [Desulfuromonadales bacterium]
MPGEDFRLGDFIAGLDWEQLPERVRTTARMCILDAIGCALAGSRCAVLDRHVQNIINQGQEGPQAVWGGRYRLQPAWAIFYNAHTAAYYDLDDGHRRAQGHPGAVIVPTALVTAAHLQRSGREVLEAVVAGYEIAVRSALRIRSQGGPRKGSAGWAAIGAGAAAAHLMHCSPQQCLNAVGLAEYYAPQAPQDRSASFPSEMKEGIPWGAYT